MDIKGTCLQSYVPIRQEPASSAEMISSLVFGESYSIIQKDEEWAKIKTDFDDYEGWISSNSIQPYNPDFTNVCDTLFAEAFCLKKRIFIPCGGMIPQNGRFKIGEELYELKHNLKPNHHLPFRIQLENVAKSFLNSPYLWGGRTYMGLDCSGYVQMVFKALGINIKRDTSQQIEMGLSIEREMLNTGDLVFFKKEHQSKVSHVGIMLSKTDVIHASGIVRIDTLVKNTMTVDKQFDYQAIAFRRIHS
jgi:hypothetical protein